MKNILLTIVSLVLLTTSLFAQRDYYDSRDRYSYCRQKAIDLSGYNGRMPNQYRSGRAFEGAIKGAASGAAASWFTGGDSKANKRAARRTAGLGFLIGAIKQGKANKNRRKQNRRRRNYQYELDECMSSSYRY